MQQQLSWASGRSGEEDWLLSGQADTEAYFGRLRKSRQFSDQAIASATRAGAKETAAMWYAVTALREAEFGNVAQARQQALAALALLPGRDVKCFATLALARSGDVSRAEKLAENLLRDFDSNTIVQRYWLPSIYAAIQLAGSNSTKPIELLESARAFELGQSQPLLFATMYPVYLRGQAYLAARRGEEAAAEFQRIIDHQGIVLNFCIEVVARLGLARAYALQQDTTRARKAYEDFLELWKDADANIPVLRQARAELANLK